MGCGFVQRSHPRAVAVGQVGTNLVGVKRDVAEEVSLNEEDLLGLVTFQSKESIHDVCVGAELNGEQRNEVMEVLRRYEEIFTEIPGKASVIEHKIDLTDDRPIRCKPYPLSYAKRGEIREEIKISLENLNFSTKIMAINSIVGLVCFRSVTLQETRFYDVIITFEK